MSKLTNNFHSIIYCFFILILIFGAVGMVGCNDSGDPKKGKLESVSEFDSSASGHVAEGSIEYISLLQEFGAGALHSIHVLRTGEVLVSQFDGKNIQNLHSTLSESEVNTIFSVFYESAVMQAESNYQVPGDQDLVVEDVFFTFASDSSNSYSQVTFHEMSLPTSLRRVVEAFQSVSVEVAPLGDVKPMLLASMVVSNENLLGVSLTNRQADTTTIRSAYPYFELNSLEQSASELIHTSLKIKDRFIPLTSEYWEILFSLTGGKSKFYIDSDQGVYLIQLFGD